MEVCNNKSNSRQPVVTGSLQVSKALQKHGVMDKENSFIQGRRKDLVLPSAIWHCSPLFMWLKATTSRQKLLQVFSGYGAMSSFSIVQKCKHKLTSALQSCSHEFFLSHPVKHIFNLGFTRFLFACFYHKV